MKSVRSLGLVLMLAMALLSLACIGTRQAAATPIPPAPVLEAQPSPTTQPPSPTATLAAPPTPAPRPAQPAGPTRTAAPTRVARATATATTLPTPVPVALVDSSVRQLVTPSGAATLLSPSGEVFVAVPPGAVDNPTTLVYSPLKASELPALPQGLSAGSRMFHLTPFRARGNEIKNLNLRAPLSITIRITDEDLKLAGDDPARITVYHYNEDKGTWRSLARNFDRKPMTLQVSVSSLSIFAVLIKSDGLVPAPTAPVAQAQPTAEPTSTPMASGPISTSTAQTPIPTPESPTPTHSPTPTPPPEPPTATPPPLPPPPPTAAPRASPNAQPDIYLLDADASPKAGRSFDVRVGAFDPDANMAALRRLDEDGNALDEFLCSGYTCAHTFSIVAPDTYREPFTERFAAVDLLGARSSILVIEGETARNQFSDRGGASSEPTPVPPPVFPLTIKGSDGVSVTFDKPPEKIVAYDGAAVETLFAIGEGHRVAATHSFVTYPPEVADIPKVGDAFSVNVEAIVALEPDLVYIFFPTFVEQLRNAGLKVLYIQTLNHNFRKTTDSFIMWGQITGNTEDAQSLAEDFEERMEQIEDIMDSQPDGPRVFYDAGAFGGDYWTAGPDTLPGEALDLLKLQNIASDISGFQPLSQEEIVVRDPEFILRSSEFATPPETFKNNPAFSEVTAVKNNGFLTLSGLLDISGPRFVKGIEELAELVYPELFP